MIEIENSTNILIGNYHIYYFLTNIIGQPLAKLKKKKNITKSKDNIKYLFL